MRVFGREAPEIIPHASDDAFNLGLRKSGKGAVDVAPSNMPNKNAAPQASRRSLILGVLAERLGAGGLALGINCAIQAGIRFRRRRRSRSLCPPLRVAAVRSPTRLRSRNCRKDSRCPQFRAAAVRQIAAFAPHWYPRERAKASRQWLA